MRDSENSGLLNSFTAEQRRAIELELERQKNLDESTLDSLNADSEKRRLQWFGENREAFAFTGGDLLLSAYKLLLRRFGITPEEAPIVSRTENEIIFHSENFCPTLEACKILGLDTSYICKRLNERSTNLLIKQLDPRLTFFPSLRQAPASYRLLRGDNQYFRRWWGRREYIKFG